MTPRKSKAAKPEDAPQVSPAVQAGPATTNAMKQAALHALKSGDPSARIWLDLLGNPDPADLSASRTGTP